MGDKNEEISFFIDGFSADNPDSINQNREQLVRLASRLENLSLFIQQLFVSTNNPKRIFGILKCITLSLEKRGCLLDTNQLDTELKKLIEFTKQNHILLTKTEYLYLFNALAEAFSYFYRYLYELCFPNYSFESLFSLVQSGNNELKIALEIMRSVVDIIKKNMPHLTENQQRSLHTSFFRNHLRDFFDIAQRIIGNPNHPSVGIALVLMLNCLKFYSRQDESAIFRREEQFLTDFQVPEDWTNYFTSTEIATRLFAVFHAHGRDNQILNNTLDALMCYSACMSSLYRVSEYKLSFIDYMASQITQIIQIQVQNEEIHLSLTRLVYTIGCIVPIQQFLSCESCVPFFESVRDLSLYSFENHKREKNAFYLKFWARLVLSCSKVQYDYPGEFLSLFSYIFCEYINKLLETMQEKSDDEYNYQLMQAAMEDYESLWIISAISPDECVDFILSVYDSLINSVVSLASIEDTDSSLVRLHYLNLIISSRILLSKNGRNLIINEKPFYIDYPNHFSRLFTAIFNSIIMTTNIKGQLTTECLDSFTYYEMSILHFACLFKRDYFQPKKSHVPLVYQGMSIVTDGKQSFDFLINRFMDDLSDIKGAPSLLYEILKFIDDVSYSGQSEGLQDLASNNEYIIALTERRAEIALDGEYSSLKRLIPLLNQIYARNIKTSDGWAKFIPYFDQKFNSIRADGFKSSGQIFILFRELRGVLKGIISCVHFLLIFRWFMENHIADTINCIQTQGNSILVIKAISQVWHFYSSNRGRKLILPNKSVEGITLFKNSLQIIKSIMDFVEDDSDNIKLQIIVKIVQPSISEKYMNFGIMEFFNDFSLNEMLDVFIMILGGWSYNQISTIEKSHLAMIKTITSCADICPSVILNSNERFKEVSMFLLKCLLHTNDENNLAAWKSACEALTKFMQFAATSGLPDMWGNFESHFVAILHGVINLPAPTVDSAASPFFLMIRNNKDFVQNVMSSIISAYEEMFAEKVKVLFEDLVEKAITSASTMDASRPFKYSLSNFKTQMRRLAIQLYEIPELEMYFVVNEY